jgi:hypothetical protein
VRPKTISAALRGPNMSIFRVVYILH